MIFAAVGLVLLIVFVVAAITAVPFMILWGVVAPVFGLPTLSLLESFALIFVFSALFKSSSASTSS